MGEIGGQGQLAEKYESISSRSESLIIRWAIKINKYTVIPVTNAHDDGTLSFSLLVFPCDSSWLRDR